MNSVMYTNMEVMCYKRCRFWLGMQAALGLRRGERTPSQLSFPEAAPGLGKRHLSPLRQLQGWGCGIGSSPPTTAGCGLGWAELGPGHLSPDAAGMGDRRLYPGHGRSRTGLGLDWGRGACPLATTGPPGLGSLSACTALNRLLRSHTAYKKLIS